MLNAFKHKALQPRGKAAISSNIERLLTTVTCKDWGDSADTTLGFGIPALTNLYSGGPNKSLEAFANAIEKKIAVFEPRLLDVEVSVNKVKGYTLSILIVGKMVEDNSPFHLELMKTY